MNDPKKKIEVNLSGLMSLKAELLRKKEEAKNIKNQFFIPKPLTDKKKTTTPATKAIKAVEDSSNYEDQMLLEKSRKILEQKSKFYDKMSQSGGSLNTDENCLVRFNEKKQTQRLPPSSSESSSSDSDDSDDEWAEFTDCLGRTRKCLKKDLDKMKARDREVSESMPQKLDTSAANWMMDIQPAAPKPPESILSDNFSTVSKHDAQRLNWEKTEEENLQKKDIHYQDVFFDEARQHGVGYYSFSTDSDERKKQQQALEEMRKKTLSAQSDKESQKSIRDKIIADRVKAAKNRQRARMGLPPLEDEVAQEATDDERQFESKEEKKRRKKDEKQKRKKEKEEHQREEERKNHIRPWDQNKDGNTNWEYKPDKVVMSQEQWNDSKRAERNPEFAPPTAKQSKYEVSTSPRYTSEQYQILTSNIAEVDNVKQLIQPTNFNRNFPLFRSNETNTSKFLMYDIEARLKYFRDNSAGAQWKDEMGSDSL